MSRWKRSNVTLANIHGYVVVSVVCLAALILPLSFSAGAVATAAMGRDLGGSAASLAWITNGFMLTFGSLLLAAGALADKVGRKRVFLGGVGIFVLFSLALSFAPSMLVVGLLRAGQGVGGAAALAAGSAAMAQEFDGQARIRAFSLLGTTFGIGLSVGPVVAGLLIEHLGWRSVFATSTVIGSVAVLLGMLHLRETRDLAAGTFDWPGAAAFSGMLALLTFAVVQAPDLGWSHPLVVAALLGAVGLVALFIVVETRSARPMLDLSLFRYGRFVGVQLLPVATCFAYVVLLILLPLRFIGIEGRTESEAGLLMMALSAPMLVVPGLAAVVTRWVAPGSITALGLVVASAGLLWLGTIAPGNAYAAIGPMLVIGTGAGVPWGLMDGLAVSVVPRERAGMASGIFNTSKVASEGIILGIVGALLAGLSAHTIGQSIGQSALSPSALNQSALNQSAGIAAAPELLAAIGHRLAAGDLDGAAALAPFDRSLLVRGYGEAFRTLTHVLAAVTLLAAVVTIVLLRPRRRAELRKDASPATAAGRC